MSELQGYAFLAISLLFLAFVIIVISHTSDKGRVDWGGVAAVCGGILGLILGIFAGASALSNKKK